jgi:hypothetical protein
MEQERKKPRLLEMLISVAVGLAILVWLGIAVPDQDWLWFIPVFNENQARILLYRDGQELALYPGDSGYEEVNEAINQIVRRVTAKDPLGISMESLEEYYTLYEAVEVFYAEPVIIHTSHGFPKADKYLFPQSGRHYNPPVVFAGYQRRLDYRPGVLVLKSREQLDLAVDNVWRAYQQQE